MSGKHYYVLVNTFCPKLCSVAFSLLLGIEMTKTTMYKSYCNRCCIVNKQSEREMNFVGNHMNAAW